VARVGRQLLEREQGLSVHDAVQAAQASGGFRCILLAEVLAEQAAHLLPLELRIGVREDRPALDGEPQGLRQARQAAAGALEQLEGLARALPADGDQVDPLQRRGFRCVVHRTTPRQWWRSTKLELRALGQVLSKLPFRMQPARRPGARGGDREPQGGAQHGTAERRTPEKS